jgi:tetratricopeptide (TPR) repeat protein
LATFHISEKLFDLPNHFAKLFDQLFKDDLDDIQWNQFSDLVSPIESTNILMAIAEYHLSQTDRSKALNIYRNLQENNKDDEILRSAIHYGILKLLESYIVADEEYRQNVMAIDIHSPTIPIFDRIILCRLIIAYMNELEDETNATLFQKELLNLQKEEWKMINLKMTPGIGQILTKFDQNSLAYLYWLDLENLYNESLPNAIITRLYSTDSTFEQIYHAVQDMINDLSDNISSLILSYAMMLDYEANDGFKDDICQSLKKAIIIGQKMPLFKEKAQLWQIKLNALTDT